MWTVFIADDEPKIRRRLRSLVADMGDDFVVCGEAEDGLQALTRIQVELPDILLVDICMPRLGGLDFIQRIQDQAVNCVIMVVTGHNEFDYARRAVRLPIFEYILKPVEKDLLHDAIRRAADVLLQRREQNELLQWAAAEVERNRGALVQQLFDDWIHGLSSPEDVEARRDALLEDFPSMGQLLGLRLLTRCFGRVETDRRERDIARVAVERLVDENLRPDSRRHVFADKSDRLFYLLDAPLGEGEEEDLRREIQERLHLPVRASLRLVRMSYDGFLEGYEALCGEVDLPYREESFLRRLGDFMDQNFRDPRVSLATAAMELAYSPGYVTRLLKLQTGYTFTEYVNRFRVLRAIGLMGQNRILMYEIAEEVGFSSQHYFSRVFKRITGSTPAEYHLERSEVT